MDKFNKDIGDGSCAGYRRQIVEMIEQIENPAILIKIYTVIKTHLEIVKESERT